MESQSNTSLVSMPISHWNKNANQLSLRSAETVSHDLESFAKHAGRSTINTSDVLLLARRNEGLEEVLKKEAKEVNAREKK